MPPARDRRLAEIEAELAKIPRPVLRNFFERTAYVSRLAASEVSHNRLTGSSFCNKTGTWLLSGTDHTDDNGQRIIPLNQRLCFPTVPQPALFGSAQLVATPISDRPVVLTATYETRPAGRPDLVASPMWNPQTEPGLYEAEHWSYTVGDIVEIDVTVHSWTPDGKPAKNVSFTWICTVPGAQLASIGG